MGPTMTPEQAVQIISQALALVKATKQEHILIEQALSILIKDNKKDE